MLSFRIIPCLDIDNGRVVKGTNFVNIKDAGNPVELAKRYNEQGADELVFLDITASSEKRDILINTVKQVADQIFIPFTVGGGIRTIEDARDILNAGADKVSINTAAIKTPELITQISKKFGSQCCVVAIDAKKVKDSWNVFIYGGREDTGIDVIGWVKKAQQLGAGEILLTSMDRDGTKDGFDLELTKKVSGLVTIPVIASGGVGKPNDFVDAYNAKADAALAASIFHFGEYTVNDIKEYCLNNGIVMRI